MGLRGVLVLDADYKKVRITLVQAGKAKHPNCDAKRIQWFGQPWRAAKTSFPAGHLKKAVALGRLWALVPVSQQHQVIGGELDLRRPPNSFIEDILVENLM
jgi:hypothetical protein